MDQPAHHDSTSRKLLVVAGSGRSGTSLFTGLTGRLGVYIPKPEVIANRSNPRGFGEPRWAVDFHNELLKSVDVSVEDGRPEAWEVTSKVAERPRARARLTTWLEEQFAESDRIVVKDPRLAWFFDLYYEVGQTLGAELSVVTMLRDPAEVMKSREIAYGTKTETTTRVAGWLNMMLSIEQRTRELPRAVVRYTDLLDDWRTALEHVDTATRMELFGRASEEQVADAGDLVDPSLRRSVTDWADMGLPPRLFDLTERTFKTYGRLVGATAEEESVVRAELDALHAEYDDYYHECETVARSSARAARNQEHRKMAKKVQAEREAAQAHASVSAQLKQRAAGLVRKVRR